MQAVNSISGGLFVPGIVSDIQPCQLNALLPDMPLHASLAINWAVTMVL